MPADAGVLPHKPGTIELVATNYSTRRDLAITVRAFFNFVLRTGRDVWRARIKTSGGAPPEVSGGLLEKVSFRVVGD
jgi:hypothetical protein